CVQAIAFPLTF
nr:immunoglobulin light chain junction region [Macaca mulatta]MOV75441.1 immunoglobulin light chain junction region [Macaca mulatta]MOV77436.1 immunoglobulin light chain junction region [Macaca mulatta]MOV85456.1 immunoglobulin light chain junction region [Macaca mulatta]MOW08113.1 immunoglobulin light chain junction region [Macaca mulatta]